jgi:hypothetical protein
MSVSSILAFVLAGVAAKNRRADRQDENRQELIALRVDNADLRRRVAELEDAVAAANVQARRDQDLIDVWRARAAAADEAHTQLLARHPRPPAGFGQLPQAAQMQAAAAQMQAQLAQHAQNAQLAQYNQAQALGQVVGLAGAQSLINAELWCNCVPARHDLFLKGE